ncbi:MAG: lyase family protein, partial [Muribaculaceae bacterium]|nr:lyase family protein [Muribaculaceae bacterium]
MSKQLWNKGFEPDNRVEQYTVGSDRELDLRLARYDVQGSIAHVRMLATIGLITDEELNILVPALQDIAADIEAGRFTIDEGVEDVHSQVEFLLTERLGPVGKKIHAGRSRNDQVLVDLKLFFRDELLTLAGAVDRLFRLL